MKLKGDFVTNSSSASYVVMIPENFELESFDELDKPYDYFEDEDEDEIVEIVSKGIIHIKGGGKLYEHDNYGAMALVRELCDNNGFVLSSIDTDSDRGTLSGVTKESVEKVLNWKGKKNENQK